MPTKSVAKPKRKSKGKRHGLHAQSLEKLADALDDSTYPALLELAHIFRVEANRIRGILR